MSDQWQVDLLSSLWTAKKPEASSPQGVWTWNWKSPLDIIYRCKSWDWAFPPYELPLWRTAWCSTPTWCWRFSPLTNPCKQPKIVRRKQWRLSHRSRECRSKKSLSSLLCSSRNGYATNWDCAFQNLQRPRSFHSQVSLPTLSQPLQKRKITIGQ